MENIVPEEVAVLSGFTSMGREELQALLEDLGLAMSLEDLLFCQQYFRDTEKEIRRSRKSASWTLTGPTTAGIRPLWPPLKK